MKNKILSNLSYVFCAALGLLNFIWLAIPYVASFVSYDLGEWGGKQSVSAGISGYRVMSLWSGGFGGVMSALFQILILILGIAMLAYGVCGLLKAFGSFKAFPDTLGKFETKKIGEYALFGYAGLNVLLLVFLIILCATNTESANEYGSSVSAGIRMSAGIFITLIFAVGTVVALKVLQKKFSAQAAAEPEITFSCSGEPTATETQTPPADGQATAETQTAPTDDASPKV